MLQKISNLKGAKVLDKKAQKTVCGGMDQPIEISIHPCGETGGKPINRKNMIAYSTIGELFGITDNVMHVTNHLSYSFHEKKKSYKFPTEQKFNFYYSN